MEKNSNFPSSTKKISRLFGIFSQSLRRQSKQIESWFQGCVILDKNTILPISTKWYQNKKSPRCANIESGNRADMCYQHNQQTKSPHHRRYGFVLLYYMSPFLSTKKERRYFYAKNQYYFSQTFIFKEY